MTAKEQFKTIRATLLGLFPGLLKFYYKRYYRFRDGSMPFELHRIAQNIIPFYFIQVGGNDGFINDPVFKLLKKNDWKGVIVEPQQEVFHKRLKRTYRFEQNVKLENLAIAATPGKHKLYKIAISNSRWATGLASFNKEILEKQIQSKRVVELAKKEGVHTPNTPENWITYEEVSCTSISELLKKHQIPKFDLLYIDTEGYDFEIIKTIDFSSIAPTILCFEHIHLSADDKSACLRLLDEKGYSITLFDTDALAIKTEYKTS